MGGGTELGSRRLLVLYGFGGGRSAVGTARESKTDISSACVQDRRLRGCGGRRTYVEHVGMQLPMFLSSGERRFARVW